MNDPRDDGHDIGDLAVALAEPLDDVARAVSRLESVGLVYRSGSAVRASGGVLHADELWHVFR